MARYRPRHAKKKSRVVPVLTAIAVLGIGGAWAATSFADRNPHDTTSTTGETTTTLPAKPAPLNGLPDTTGWGHHHAAVIVKIENTPDALPQYGVDSADVVYEEIVNGGITRLAAVFNSRNVDRIGPVRSVRPTDTQIAFPLGGLFVYSGGAAYAIRSISTAPVRLIDETRAGNAMFRDTHRWAPHNLFAYGTRLYAFAAHPVPPKPLFTYRGETDTVGGKKMVGAAVYFPSIYTVTWGWNAGTQSFDRHLFGKLDVTGTGKTESPRNVIIQFTNYVNGIGTMNSYGDLQSGGKAIVLTKGREIVGTWSRTSRSAPIVYRTSTGVIPLTPGQTWVELINTGARVRIW